MLNYEKCVVQEPKMNKNRGFTLIELMVTVVVLGILASLAAPSMLQIIRKNQLNTEVLNFVNVLSETRSEALFKHQNKILALDPSISTPFKVWTFNTAYLTNVDTNPKSIEFNFMGGIINENNVCFEFKHANDDSLKSVVVVQKSGLPIYNKSLTTCP